MKEIYLNCVLMGNNEVIFNGRSLGFLTEEEKKKWVKKPSDLITKKL